MSLSVQLANDLSSGPVYLFADWPNVAVSTFGAGVYTFTPIAIVPRRPQ